MRKFIAIVLLIIFRKNKLRSLQELSKFQWLSLSEIKKIQNRKFLNLINHCKKNVPYYKKNDSLNKVKSLSDITKLPFLTKKIIKENYEDLKATNISKKYFIPNFTSGSTGETLNFFSDKRNVVNFGLTMRNNMWTGWNIGEKQAMLWGSHYDISKSQKFFNRIKNSFIHRNLYLSSYDMSESNMLKYRETINKYKPKLLTAYPTGLFLFINFLKKRGLSIYKPKGIICSGETLYEYQREKIESFYCCKIYNRYGCREVGNIAHQCEKQEGLHINAEHIFVEVLDENGYLCKPGELGEVVVTHLDNYVFPFIRYKIGDIATLTDRACSCGRGLPLFEKILGRVWDVIVGANGNKIVGTFWLIKEIKGIKHFQVVQENFRELIIRLVVNETFGEMERKKLVERVAKNCGGNMRIHIQLVDKIPLTKSGKHKFIISKVSPFVK